MKSHLFLLWGLVAFISTLAAGEDQAAFSSIDSLTNREIRLRLAGPKAATYRIDATTNLASWNGLIALTNSTGSIEHIDTAAPIVETRFYRAEQLAGSVLTGDYLSTDDGDVIIHPVFHATLILGWKDVVICIDPTSDQLTALRGLPKADIVLVTHEHGDHYNASTISAVLKTNGSVLVSKSTFPQLPAALKSLGAMMTNGMTTNLLGLNITAVPAYNGNHPKGNGNGYVLTIGGRKLYISGDTDDVAEMRALQGIDVAFICMDAQFNMNMTKAASAVLEFKPRIVFPYHYNSQNPVTFKQMIVTNQPVGRPIEVRLRKWQ